MHARLKTALQQRLQLLEKKNVHLRACCNLGSTFDSNTIEKPESHGSRKYRALTLTNGLRVLLAHDPFCDKAASALAVSVGKLHEPAEIPGLVFLS